MIKEFKLEILEDPKVFMQNRLKAHSNHKYFANHKEALENQSSFRQLLNGTWRFKFDTCVEEAVARKFYTKDFDYTAFDFIQVPGHFELQGYGKPHYTNVSYPWDGFEIVKPGQIAKHSNVVGSYLRTFSVPKNFSNTFICFDGVDSAFALWLNGHYVGYSTDSCSKAHFDLTPFVTEGENRLCVQVFKYSSGSLLEDQDFFRFSGVFRDVYLYTKPSIHLEDLFVKTTLKDNYQNALINLETEYSSLKGSVNVTFKDRDGKVVFNTTKALKDNLEFELSDIHLWSAEKPYLYDLVLEIFDDKENLCEVVTQKVGLREFKLINKLMCLNGKRIVFNGVNRHEFFPETGRVLPNKEALVKDLLIMKDLNINAIRTCHYPNNELIYDLCDELGFYVIDETNLETHGTWQQNGVDLKDSKDILPHNDERYLDAVIARGQAMLERDKNHPCVIIYSCGNESFGGSVIYALSQYFKQRDNSRLVHYEGLFHDRSFNDTSDMESQMYTSVENIQKFLAQDNSKPFICCEYAHAMGNSCGGLKLYTELTRTQPLYQGGFIWDFVDQALYAKLDDGTVALQYGGDFDDRPNDGNFSGNGIVFADRTLTPKAYEVRACYQSFEIEIKDREVLITNLNLFTNLNEYKLIYKVSVDGVITKEFSEKPLDLKAGDTKSFKVSSEVLDYLDSLNLNFDEISLIVEIEKTQTTAYGTYKQGANAQKVFGNYQVNLPNHKVVRVVDGLNNIGIIGEDCSYLISKPTGFITSIKTYGKEVLKNNMYLNFFRALIDNDRGNRAGTRLGAWHTASLYSYCTSCNLVQENNTYVVKTTHVLGGTKSALVTINYELTENGALAISLDYKKSLELPEFMVDFSFMLPAKKEYQSLEYYAKGLTDNYVDRDSGLNCLVYHSDVKSQMVAYLKPQECGNHQECRYVKLVDSNGHGICVAKTDENFNFSALPYSVEQLLTALHDYELPKSYCSYLKISQDLLGVGGDDSWGADVLPQYRKPNQDCSLKVVLTTI